MKKIAVLTATRAEYGLLKPIIDALNKTDDFSVKVVVTGAHLSPEFGLTYKDIESDGIRIHKKIEILLSTDTPSAISKSMGLAMMGFADYFAESTPDALMVLGDRYETLAVCCAAANARIPIIHLYGGETTEGAVDEAVRHAITKMSYLHFTSTKEYRKRVIQLGESPERVFAVGGTGAENALKTPLMSKEELEKSLAFSLDRDYAVVTFHPVTLEEDTSKKQFGELLKAFGKHGEMKYIITKAGADSDGRIINKMVDEFANTNDNVCAVNSLGLRRYLSALKYCKTVIGNSSSGLLEAPSFKIPTVNIGDRQRGRIRAESVIDCEPVCDDICRAIDKANSTEFVELAHRTKNPYGDGNTSEKIVRILKEKMTDFTSDRLKKKFYDININVE
ncbi:MAG: UDP-N-acetylglucosamine 2-epimerase (hydrolyzing) [Oscillospiraceae bacterium]|nr:UDP-N-acetylglucosamine 2-epimerase (hydrolyzing) [Oscillospiraceae bacterium]